MCVCVCVCVLVPLCRPQALNEVVTTVASRRAKGSTATADVLDAGGWGGGVNTWWTPDLGQLMGQAQGRARAKAA